MNKYLATMGVFSGLLLSACGSDDPVDTTVTMDSLNTVLNGNYVLASDMPMDSHPELAFPMIGTLPELLQVGNPEAFHDFMEQAIDDGFNEHDYGALVQGLHEATRAIRMSFTGDVTGQQQAAEEMIPVMEQIEVYSHYEPIGSRGGEYKYEIEQDIYLPHCDFGPSVCEVSLAIDVILRFPSARPSFSAINDSNDYRIIFDDFNIELRHFSASNERSSLNLAMNDATHHFSFESLVVDLFFDEDNQLEGTYTSATHVIADVQAQFINDMQLANGDLKQSKTSLSLEGELGAMNFTADFPSGMINAEILETSLTLDFISERMPAREGQSSGGSSSTSSSSTSSSSTSSSSTSSSSGGSSSTGSTSSTSTSGGVPPSGFHMPAIPLTGGEAIQSLAFQSELVGRHVLADNANINTYAERRFPMVGFLPEILSAGDQSGFDAFIGSSQIMGTDLQQYKILYSGLMEAVRGIRFQHLVDYTGIRTITSNSIPTPTGLIMNSRPIAENGPLSWGRRYSARQIITIPGCDLGYDSCSVNLDIDVLLEYPDKSPYSDTNTSLYFWAIEDLRIHLNSFKAYNATSYLEFSNADASKPALHVHLLELEGQLGATITNRFTNTTSYLNTLQPNIQGVFIHQSMDDGTLVQARTTGTLAGHAHELQTTADFSTEQASAVLDQANLTLDMQTTQYTLEIGPVDPPESNGEPVTNSNILQHQLTGEYIDVMSENEQEDFNPTGLTIPTLAQLQNIMQQSSASDTATNTTEEYWQVSDVYGSNKQRFDILYKAINQGLLSVVDVFLQDIAPQDKVSLLHFGQLNNLNIDSNILPLGRAGKSYHYTLRQTIAMPDCDLGANICDIDLDIDVLIDMPMFQANVDILQSEHTVYLQRPRLRLSTVTASNAVSKLDLSHPYYALLPEDVELRLKQNLEGQVLSLEMLVFDTQFDFSGTFTNYASNINDTTQSVTMTTSTKGYNDILEHHEQRDPDSGIDIWASVSGIVFESLFTSTIKEVPAP